MDTYADEAISKLTDMIDPDSDLAKVLDAMLDRGAAYEGTGRGADMEYTVKFILRTAAPSGSEPESDDNELAPADVQVEESFWDRVKGLFN